MVEAIKRAVVSTSGTGFSEDGDQLRLDRQGVGFLRPQAATPEIANLLGRVDHEDWPQTEALLAELARVIEEEPDELTPAFRHELALAIPYVLEAVDANNAWGALARMDELLQLGLPQLSAAAGEQGAADLAALASSLQERLQIRAAVLNAAGEGDISHNMNLYVHSPLYRTLGKLEGLGEDFGHLRDRVGTTLYSGSTAIDTADFERTSKTLLIDRESREVLSLYPGDSFCRLRFLGQAAFAAEQGQLFFTPTAGEASRPVLVDGEPVRLGDDGRVYPLAAPSAEPLATGGQLLEIFPVAAEDVVARPLIPGDIPPRANIRFAWQDRPIGSTHDVSWWGQCHASGGLGALGFMPARSACTLLDEKSGGQVELSADDVTNMMVFLASSCYVPTGIGAEVGKVNLSETHLDDDPPHIFHEFVADQIARGLPFNVEAHPYAQKWNYPVHQASIEAVGARRRRPGGTFAQTYVMRLTTSGGMTGQLTYDIFTDARGNIVGSEWDLAACEKANGKTNAIPDTMTSFLGPSVREIRFSADTDGGRRERWTSDSLLLTADLYFASQNAPPDGGRVYAVRSADGRLLAMSKDEYEAFAAQHGAAGHP